MKFFDEKELFAFKIGKRLRVHVFNFCQFGMERTGNMIDFEIGPVFIRVYCGKPQI